MKSYQKTILPVALTCILAIFAVIGVYWKYFHCFPISRDTAKWGAFGDYFGGVLNPIIGMANLIALIYLSYKISDNEGVRSENDIKNQKIFALYSLQYDALRDLSKILEKVQIEVIESGERSALALVLVRNEIHAFINTNDILFPSLKQQIHREVVDSIMTLTNTVGDYYRAKQVNDLRAIDDVVQESIREVEQFNSFKTAFISRLQSDILI
jgi:hypothetical protein